MAFHHHNKKRRKNTKHAHEVENEESQMKKFFSKYKQEILKLCKFPDDKQNQSLCLTFPPLIPSFLNTISLSPLLTSSRTLLCGFMKSHFLVFAFVVCCDTQVRHHHDNLRTRSSPKQQQRRVVKSSWDSSWVELFIFTRQVR